MDKKIIFIVKAAIIAALYTALTVSFSFLAYNSLQVRISEALAILPFFTPAAIPGLFIGCILANLGSPLGILDILLGSLCSLVAAFLASKIKIKALVPLPAVLINALVVPYVLWVVLGIPYLASVFWVGLGQVIAVYGLGYPLLLFIDRNIPLKNILKN
ncbi:MAG: QueT transporter family protein [Eubacteriales bacterium]